MQLYLTLCFKGNGHYTTGFSPVLLNNLLVYFFNLYSNRHCKYVCYVSYSQKYRCGLLIIGTVESIIDNQDACVLYLFYPRCCDCWWLLCTLTKSLRHSKVHHNTVCVCCGFPASYEGVSFLMILYQLNRRWKFLVFAVYYYMEEVGQAFNEAGFLFWLDMFEIKQY